MIGILIISHQNLGESLINSATHVMGECPPLLKHLGVETNDDPVEVLQIAKELVNELDKGDGVLILSDIYGATPCNIVTKLMNPGHVEGVAGVNLPMLVRALTYRNGDIKDLALKALSGGRDGVIHFTEEACKGNRHD